MRLTLQARGRTYTLSVEATPEPQSSSTVTSSTSVAPRRRRGPQLGFRAPEPLPNPVVKGGAP